MKQYFTLDPSCSRSPFPLLLFPRRAFSFPFTILDLVSPSPKLSAEQCLHELHHKRSRGRINFLPSPGEIGEGYHKYLPRPIKDTQRASPQKTTGRSRSIIADRRSRARNFGPDVFRNGVTPRREFFLPRDIRFFLLCFSTVKRAGENYEISCRTKSIRDAQRTEGGNTLPSIPRHIPRSR